MAVDFPARGIICEIHIFFNLRKNIANILIFKINPYEYRNCHCESKIIVFAVMQFA
jgi:hypothetical protein